MESGGRGKRTPRRISRRRTFSFIGSGSIAIMPVGVPIEFAKQYPQANAGVGCTVRDIPFREKQEKYARAYNEKMYEFVSKNPEVGRLKAK